MRPDALSIVVPIFNEAGAAAELIDEIAAALDGVAFEIIAVDDGSTDASPAVLAQLAAADPRVRVVTHPERAGQSSAIRSGVRAARHAWIATLDGDGQNPPDQIPRLLAALRTGDHRRVGLVQGQRAIRRDGAWKRLGSSVANAIRSAALRDGVRDSGCGLKLFRRSAYLELPYFEHIHRFMPAMMLREGWEVRLVDVTHRPRASGQSKYSNMQRALVGIVDLAGAAWLIRRTSPLTTPAREPAPPPAVGANRTTAKPAPWLAEPRITDLP